MYATINEMFTLVLLQTLYFILKSQSIVTGFTAATQSIYGRGNIMPSNGVRKRVTFLSSPSTIAERIEGQEHRAKSTVKPLKSKFDDFNYLNQWYPG